MTKKAATEDEVIRFLLTCIRSLGDDVRPNWKFVSEKLKISTGAANIKYKRIVARFEKSDDGSDANSAGSAEPATPPSTPAAKRGKRCPAKKGTGNGRRCAGDRAKKRKLDDEDAGEKREANNADDGVTAHDGVAADGNVTTDDSVTADTEMEQELRETEEIEGDSNKENEAEY